MSKRKRRENRGGQSLETSVVQPHNTRMASSNTTPAAAATRRSATPSRRPARFTDRLRNPGRVELFAAAAVLLAVVAGIYLLFGQQPGVSAGRQVPLERAVHVPEGQPVTHESSPPSSGTHYLTTKPWGVYQQEVAEGYWVHNLEHGGVVLLYNCPDGCADLQKQLEDTFKTFPPGKYGQVKLVVTPYSKMEHKIAAVAWGWVLELDSFDRDQLLQFYQAHVDRGPEDVP